MPDRPKQLTEAAFAAEIARWLDGCLFQKFSKAQAIARPRAAQGRQQLFSAIRTAFPVSIAPVVRDGTSRVRAHISFLA
jgi:hypothetical protein